MYLFIIIHHYNLQTMRIKPSFIPVFLIYFFLVACSTSKSSAFGYSKKEATDTVTTIDGDASSKLVAFKAPNNKIYYAKRVPATQPGEFSTSASDAVMARSVAADPATEKFRDGQGGGVREEAKTTFSTASYQNRTLKWLVNNLPSNQAMDAFNLGNNSPRCAPENKNVHVKTAYLYIFKHEDDKDYHLLIGNKKKYAEANYIFNAEISGLPVNFVHDLDQLTKVRKDAVDFFKTQKSCSSQNYILSIPIEIEGSLFYDFFHKNETAKCKNIQANTAWEIHPVHSIIFK